MSSFRTVMSSRSNTKRFADRLGTTYHRSPLLMKIHRLMREYRTGADCPLGWLLDVANARGARIVTRAGREGVAQAPPKAALSDEELVAGCCLLEQPDELQTLRAAAQLISAGSLDHDRLDLLIERERLKPILYALAQAALQVEPDHPCWRWIAERCVCASSGVPLLHWTRLAEPIPDKRHVASGKWRLVA